MRGFTDRALVLLSSPEGLDECSSIYKYDYKTAIRNLVEYLRSVDIAHDCLITDALATNMDMQAPRWLATGVPEDLFFMRNYCGIPDYKTVPISEEMSTRVRGKFPIQRGISAEERFPIVSRRVKLIEHELIASYRLVVVFGKLFHVKSKPGDGVAVLRVNEKKFYTSIELSGVEVPINEFLQTPYANQCLSEWGKYSG